MTSRKMTFLKSILLLIGLGMIAALVACSSSSSSTTTKTYTVTLSSAPTSLLVSGTFSITATTNDPSGVTWSCTPGNTAATCGSFSAATSLTGVAVTYTAPATVPTSTVVITATSITDTAVFASTPAITINAASGITVTLSTPPPASMPASTTASVAATVANDPNNAGVTWSCSPGNSAATCGSFSSSTSASGTAVTYTAPPSGGSVTITATSVTDDAQSASAQVGITTIVATTLAAGNYVFSLAGTDASPHGVGPYFYAGVFTVNSSGAITLGEQDFSDYYYFVSGEPITGGNITGTSDGNLLITLTFSDNCINNGADTVTFDASLVSTSKALLAEYDAWASSSGELDLQATSLSAPSGGFAFFTTGVAPSSGASVPVSVGGVINVDSAGGISGTGSVFDLNYNGSGTQYQDELFSASTVTGPDSLGFVTFTLNSTVFTSPVIILDGYMVDANHIRLVENWASDHLEGTTGGTALAQAGTGTFGTSSISGSSYVVGTAGVDDNGALQVAGVLTFNADGSVTGNVSFNDLASQSPQGGTALEAESATTPCSSGSAVTACYTIDAAGVGNDGGTGRVTVTNVTDGVTFNYNLQLYLTGDGHALVISMDSSDVLGGLGLQQASTAFTAASLSGSYALNVGQVGVVGTSEVEQDGVGAFAADGVGNLAGFLDQNGTFTVGSLSPDTPFSDTFAVTSTNGVFTVTNNGGKTFNATAYLVDTTKGVVIENDDSQLTLGYFDLQ